MERTKKDVCDDHACARWKRDCNSCWAKGGRSPDQSEEEEKEEVGMFMPKTGRDKVLEVASQSTDVAVEVSAHESKPSSLHVRRGDKPAEKHTSNEVEEPILANPDHERRTKVLALNYCNCYGGPCNCFELGVNEFTNEEKHDIANIRNGNSRDYKIPCFCVARRTREGNCDCFELGILLMQQPTSEDDETTSSTSSTATDDFVTHDTSPAYPHTEEFITRVVNALCGEDDDADAHVLAEMDVPVHEGGQIDLLIERGLAERARLQEVAEMEVLSECWEGVEEGSERGA